MSQPYTVSNIPELMLVILWPLTQVGMHAFMPYLWQWLPSLVQPWFFLEWWRWWWWWWWWGSGGCCFLGSCSHRFASFRLCCWAVPCLRRNPNELVDPSLAEDRHTELSWLCIQGKAPWKKRRNLLTQKLSLYKPVERNAQWNKHDMTGISHER